MIETVLMLFVMSLILMIPVVSIDKMIESAQIDLFFREVTSNITMMQNYAILNNERTQVYFYSKDEVHYIDFNVPHQPDHPLNKTIAMDAPHFIYTKKGVTLIYFANGTGTPSSSRTVKFYTTSGNYDLTFWLGSGRFEVEKVSN